MWNIKGYNRKELKVIQALKSCKINIIIMIETKKKPEEYEDTDYMQYSVME